MKVLERVGARVTALATLWFVLLAVAATAPALFGNRSLGPESLLDSDPLLAHGDPPPPPVIYDTTRIFYDFPRDFAAADGLHHGRIDLWNPLVGLGMPLWAECSGLFFPARIPFYLAPSRRSYDVATALRLVIAGLGAFLLARRRGLAPLPALAAGSLFELCGTMIGTLQFGAGAPPCLLPWVLLGAEVIAQSRSVAAAAATGLALGLTASSGHPMLVTVVFVGFGAAVAGHVLAAIRVPRDALVIGALATLAVALGLAVAAPSLLPVLEAQDVGRLYKNAKGFRAYVNWYRDQTWTALPVALFAPTTLAGLRDGLSLGFPYSLVVPVVGVLGLIFALAGLIRRGLDFPLFVVWLVGIGLTVAPPVLGEIGRLPLVNFVYPMYAWSLVVLPLTQSAGRGIAGLTAKGEQWTLLAALAAVVVTGAVSLVHVKDLAPGTLLKFPVRQIFLASLTDWSGWLRLALPVSLLPLVVISIAVATRTRYAHYCGIAATVLAALELLVSVAPTAWFRDSHVLTSPPSPALRFLQQALAGDEYRMLAYPRPLGLPATLSLFGVRDLRATAVLPAERYLRYLEAIAPNAPWYVWQFPNEVIRHPLLDLASVRYIVRPPTNGSEAEPQLRGDASVRSVYRDDRVAIYQNDAALPRARIVRGVVVVRDREDAVRALMEAAAGSTHAGAGLVDRVFIEPSADGHMPREADAEPISSTETVHIVPSPDRDRVEIQASLERPGWIVLADTFYPGWTATVSGVVTPIHPVNVLFRGVLVPAGTHRIVFRYEPGAFRLGVVLAVVALSAIGFLLIRQRRDRVAVIPA